MIFIVIFIVSLILPKHITKPVRKLIDSTERISNGDFDSKIDIDSEDEIGELAGRFKIMVRKIREQISVIEKDKDDLKEAQMYSKAFFDNVTHELKTPFTTILGYAQIIKENGFSDKNFFDKGISCIINESKRMNKMVVQVLEISRFNSTGYKYQFKRVNFSELIVKTCDEMGIKARKYGINIRCLIQDGLVIYGDEDKLKEVIINLIDNSIKYGNVNSVVYCKAYHENGHIYVKIKDRGKGSGFIGISAKNISRHDLKGSRRDIISGSDILKKCAPEIYKSISQEGEYVTFNKYIYNIKLSADGNQKV